MSLSFYAFLVPSVSIFTWTTTSNKLGRPFKNRLRKARQSCVDLKRRAQTKANHGLL